MAAHAGDRKPKVEQEPRDQLDRRVHLLRGGERGGEVAYQRDADSDGIELAGVFFDTMLASYLLNPSKRVHSLDQIVLDYFGHRMISYEDVVGKGKKQEGFARVPLEKAVPYASEDADMTLAAYGVLCQGVGWIVISWAVVRVEASRVGLLLLLQPTLTFVWDILFFGRPTTTVEILGASLTLVAIYFGSTRRR